MINDAAYLQRNAGGSRSPIGKNSANQTLDQLYLCVLGPFIAKTLKSFLTVIFTVFTFFTVNFTVLIRQLSCQQEHLKK
jgi:hypothetical protein